MLDVYRSVYKLTAQPFRLSPDHHFSFSHRSYDNAKAYLKYAIHEGEGFVAITGAPGTGKTTLILSLVEELDRSKVNIATLDNPQLDNRNLVEKVVDAFGLPPRNEDEASPLSILQYYLSQQSLGNKRSILIVDEAQSLPEGSLEELRLLSNLQYNSKLLLQVFLVGQESLMDMIRSPGMEHLHQRLIAASHLDPLVYDETVAYVGHRLRKVGWNNDPQITKDAMGLIHKFSAGVPRRINLICHRLFLRGGLSKAHTLSGEDALAVIVELHKEGLLSTSARVDQWESKKRLDKLRALG